jgi:hypothetical protein
MMFLETRILAQIEVEIPEQKKVKVSCSKKATRGSSFWNFRNFTFFVRNWNEKLEIAPKKI